MKIFKNVKKRQIERERKREKESVQDYTEVIANYLFYFTRMIKLDLFGKKIYIRRWINRFAVFSFSRNVSTFPRDADNFPSIILSALASQRGGRTANWVGESPDYIPYKHETNRDTFDDRTNDSVAITGGGRGSWSDRGG